MGMAVSNETNTAEYTSTALFLHTSMTLLKLVATCKTHEGCVSATSIHACVHLIQPSPDSCCRPNPCSTCSRMGRCSVSQEGGLGWSLCTCKYRTHARSTKPGFPDPDVFAMPFCATGRGADVHTATHLKKGFFKSRRLLDFDPV